MCDRSIGRRGGLVAWDLRHIYICGQTCRSLFLWTSSGSPGRGSEMVIKSSICRATVGALALAFTFGCDVPPAKVAPRDLDAEAVVVDVCDAACSSGALCCTEVFVHGNGSPVAWLRRGAPIAVPAEPQQILVAFKNWLIDHPAVAGLDAMADTTPLAGLTLWPTPPQSFGSLKVTVHAKAA